jgi:hypothetical protein
MDSLTWFQTLFSTYREKWILWREKEKPKKSWGGRMHAYNHSTREAEGEGWQI